MINLKFMNKAVGIADGNEFKLLYVIANTVSLKKEGHTRIYREMLADMLNLSTKQITRLTNSLEEKGLIKKDLVFERDKTVCYYSLNLDIIGKKSTTKLDKNVPLNNSKKDIIKEKELNNSKKDIKIENNNIKKEFKIKCNNEKIEENLEEIYEDKELEKELEKAIEENLIPSKENKKVIVKKQFLQQCNVLNKKVEIPIEETLSEYLKRTRAYSY